jgi:hypothetical protein
MLRNKHTGEIKTLTEVIHEAYVKHELESLAKLNEEWEDYVPKEPLIKDEKIRKAVRTWAEANGEKDNIVFTRSCEYSDYMFYTNGGGDICFEQDIDLTTGSYTIAELCGEEEDA